ncbi:uncharacterized protein LOC105701165 isoform X2 [Orussus abietinus]|uniref:uncharacterized protein LOC105701165 isoform X2 n=1 Tax=Orussus abietinus TaxID=222816 RepID=UPI0006265B49|nr:uncharacterized protein LOC105701165 isoform X2 [Orussus abietinus]
MWADSGEFDDGNESRNDLEARLYAEIYYSSVTCDEKEVTGNYVPVTFAKNPTLGDVTKCPLPTVAIEKPIFNNECSVELPISARLKCKPLIKDSVLPPVTEPQVQSRKNIRTGESIKKKNQNLNIKWQTKSSGRKVNLTFGTNTSEARNNTTLPATKSVACKTYTDNLTAFKKPSSTRQCHSIKTVDLEKQSNKTVSRKKISTSRSKEVKSKGMLKDLKSWKSCEHDNILINSISTSSYSSSKHSMHVKMGDYENVDFNQSDSEDSIIEVPVPPKPQPPLIDINDSDNDLGSDSDNKSYSNSNKSGEKGQTSGLLKTIPYSYELSSGSDSSSESSCSSENSEFALSDKCDSRAAITKGDTSDSTSDDGIIVCSEKAINLEVSSYSGSTNDKEHGAQDLILNCTEVQKSAFNLNEIRELGKEVTFRQRYIDDTIIENYGPGEAGAKSNLNAWNDSWCIGMETSQKQSENLKTSRSRKQEKTEKSHDEVPANLNPDRASNEVSHNSLTENIEYDEAAQTDTPRVIDVIQHIEEAFTSNEDSQGRKKRLRPESLSAHENSNKQARYIDDEATNVSLCAARNKQETLVSKCITNDKPVRYNLLRRYSNKASSRKEFYDNSWGGEDFDVEKLRQNMSKDPKMWVILDDDLVRSSRKGRYWDMPNRSRIYHQESIGDRIHKAILCRICGNTGHEAPRCPQKMCLTCGRKQKSFTATCYSCRAYVCTMCNSKGHKVTGCPDLWRRYHQTTKPSELNVPTNLMMVMKPTDLLSCCNCAQNGHESTACFKYRWSQHFQTPTAVTNYTDGPNYEESSAVSVGLDSSCAHPPPPADTTNVEGLRLPESQGSGTVDDASAARSSNTTAVPKKPAKTREANVIYQCGICSALPKECKAFNLTHFASSGFFEGRIVPTFLEDLKDVFPFEVKITRCRKIAKQKVNIYAKTLKPCRKHLRKLLRMWLALDDEDKDCFAFKDLPKDRLLLIKFLRDEIKKLYLNFGDAREIMKRIRDTQKQMQGNKHTDNSRKKVASNLKELKSKLLLTLYGSPLVPQGRGYIARFRKSVQVLQRSQEQLVSAQSYLSIVLLYIKVFSPHLPSNVLRMMAFYSTEDKCQSKGEKAQRKMSTRRNESQLVSKKRENSRYSSNGHGVSMFSGIDSVRPIVEKPRSTLNSHGSVSPDVGNLESDHVNMPNNVRLSEMHPSTSLSAVTLDDNDYDVNDFYQRARTDEYFHRETEPGELENHIDKNDFSLVGTHHEPSLSDRGHFFFNFPKDVASGDSRLWDRRLNFASDASFTEDWSPVEETNNRQSQIEATRYNNDNQQTRPYTSNMSVRRKRSFCENSHLRKANAETNRCKSRENVPNDLQKQAESLIEEAFSLRLPHLHKAAVLVQKRLYSDSLTIKQIKHLGKLVEKYGGTKWFN